MAQIQYVSEAKLTELQAELKFLKHEKIPATALRIDEARQMGDLSENAEYHAAREEMAWAQSRVKELESIIDNASIITAKADNGEVQLGTKIVVSVNGKEKTYTVVGAQESDPFAGKVSNDSPLGRAFMGKKKGDVVEVEAPAGLVQYTILSLE